MERNPSFGNLKIHEVSPISNQAGEEKKKVCVLSRTCCFKIQGNNIF